MRSNEQAPLAADETIVELYWARDERAIEETDRKYGAYLMTVAHRILQSREDSEECLNDTYLKTWNSIPPQRPNCLKAFLTKITRTVAIDRYRRERRQKRIPSECTLSLSELAETLCGDSPEVEYESAVVGKVINTYLRTLSERDMCLFISRYFCSDPIGDIAKKCGMSESGVKKALLRLREGLRNELEKEGIRL
jgi:RNA polymerase sigma-70 factor (ECF subfamily)